VTFFISVIAIHHDEIFGQIPLGNEQNTPEKRVRNGFDRSVTVRSNAFSSFVCNKSRIPRVGYVEENQLLALSH